jgi:hypothetical protein
VPQRVPRLRACDRYLWPRRVALKIQWDGGADENVMPQGIFRKYFASMRLQPPSESVKFLRGVGGVIPVRGRAEFLVAYGSRSFIDYFVVADCGTNVLIGSRARAALGLSLGGLVPPSHTAHPSTPAFRGDTPRASDSATLFDIHAKPLSEIPRPVARMIETNGAIPADAVCTHRMATIRVDIPPSMKPHYEYPRRIPWVKHAAIDAQVVEWLRDGVIEKCPESSPWNLNLVVVNKATDPGSPPKFRVCLDPRPINKVTPNDLHPLPHILDYLDDACGARVFSSLDLKGSFHQFDVYGPHRNYLAFTWNQTQYRFRRGPFGLEALAGQFQRVMSDILGDLPYVRVYIDDIIVFSSSIEEHTSHLMVVLLRLNTHLLRIQPPKCRFYRPSVPYLGHVVSGHGIRVAGARVMDIQAVPRPESGRQMQSFLGMINFVRSFIPCLATLAAPLDGLRTLNTINLKDPLVWTLKCEAAFLAIKDAVAAAPVLAKPKWAEPFFVATDASSVGVGAVLFQGSRDLPRYIVCVSRSLTPSERNYSATKKELLGMIFALRK